MNSRLVSAFSEFSTKSPGVFEFFDHDFRIYMNVYVCNGVKILKHIEDKLIINI